TAEQAERFLRDELPRAKKKALLGHLLRGCTECSKLLGPLLPLVVKPEKVHPDAPAGSGNQYDAPIARALAAVLSRRPQPRKPAWARVERGLDLLRSNPRGIDGLTDDEAEELRGWPFVEILLQLSFEERYRNPVEMLRLALFAKTAAENLDPAE